MTRTRCTLFAALPLLAVALGGCSASDDTDAPQSESQVVAASKAWDVALENCMRDAGFDLDAFSEDGTEVDLSDDEREALMGGYETCMKSTIATLGKRPVSESEKKQTAEVEAHLRETVDCLRDRGYDVPDPGRDQDGSFTVMEGLGDAPQDAVDQCEASGDTVTP